MVSFWSKLKSKRHVSTSSNLDASDFAQFYGNIMQDDNSNLSDEQIHVSNFVQERYLEHMTDNAGINIEVSVIDQLLRKLKTNSSPGSDGIMAEHILHSNSNSLLQHIADLCSIILSYNIVPYIFTQSIMVPVIKKSTLDPNEVSSYRPITISSTFAKLTELLMVPNQDVICDTQYGFRQGGDTVSATAFMNDITCYFKDQGSPVYTCSLDAEKCFDRIWHSGLFYKLWGVLPTPNWVFLYNWYNNFHAKVRWQGTLSQSFNITRGQKQGSLLSPVFFNYFINDMLLELKNDDNGVCIDNLKFTSFAFADDVTLLSCTVSGLQHLIDICYNYAQRWRFSFGVKKSKCMVIGKGLFKSNFQHHWKLGDVALETVSSLSILGVSYSSDIKYDTHVNDRVNACRRSMYSLQEIGMSYPGLDTNVKVHLWKTMGLPSLLYASEAIALRDCNIKELNSYQGSCIKRCLGIAPRSHHSNLLKAAGLQPVQDVIGKRVVSLYNRIFKTQSPSHDINMYFLSRFISQGEYCEGTLLDRVIRLGLSPVSVAFNPVKCNNCDNSDTVLDKGIVDSLHFLIHHENYIKPWSSEHILTTLLTKAF